MRITLRTVAEPVRQPVTLEQLRGHVRVDDGSDDAMLNGYLIAARTHIEKLLNCPILPRTMRGTFEEWPHWLPWSAWSDGPRSDSLQLLRPVMSVDVITYTNAVQVSVPWTGFISRTSQGGSTLVRPATGQDWPVLGTDPLITLDATCGLVTAGSAVPEPLVQAILLMAAHLYLNREEVLTGSRIVAIQLPLGIADLIAPYRWRWLG